MRPVRPVIALIDGEHHPAAVRDALDSLDPAWVIFCGGEEKVRAGVLEDAERHYGRPVELGPPEDALRRLAPGAERSEEHTSELQSLMRISYAVFCLKKK